MAWKWATPRRWNSATLANATATCRDASRRDSPPAVASVAAMRGGECRPQRSGVGVEQHLAQVVITGTGHQRYRPPDRRPRANGRTVTGMTRPRRTIRVRADVDLRRTRARSRVTNSRGVRRRWSGSSCRHAGRRRPGGRRPVCTVPNTRHRRRHAGYGTGFTM